MQGREKDQDNRGGEKIAAEEIAPAAAPRGGDPRRAGEHGGQPAGRKSCAYLVVKNSLCVVEVRRFLREQGVAELLPDRVESVDAFADAGRQSR